MKKFSIHPISIIIWVWLLCVLGPIVAMSYVLAILLHELGHFFVAKFLGYSLSSFSISPYGVALSYTDESLDFKDEIKIALAGPVTNLISVLFVAGLWWICPAVYYFSESFVAISLLLALFNLLPAYPLDGGRVFICVSQYFFSGKVAKKITIFVNVFFSCMFFLMFIVFAFINFNPTYLLFSVFLVGGILDLQFVSKFEKISIFCKKTKNFTKPIVVLVSNDTSLRELSNKMQNSKTFLFCVQLDNGRCVFISEKMVLNLLKNYQINEKLKNILKK